MKNAVAICLFLLLPSAVVASIVTGGDTVYHATESDSLPLVSSKFGVDMAAIARGNNLAAERLRPGQELRLNTRKIAPKTVDNGIIIDIPGRMLYYFRAGELKQSFPVGLGMPRWRGVTRWRTPAGAFTITGKVRNPVWYVPESIQWQMQIEGKPVLTEVPPGPDNPLGGYALYTSIRSIVIHETIWPATVYQFRSHGCIRVLPKDIERLYEQVEVGTPGELVYEPVKAALTDEGKVFLEVNPDVYGKAGDPLNEAIHRISELQVADDVDWSRVRRVAEERSGIAEDVTMVAAQSTRPQADPAPVPAPADFTRLPPQGPKP